MARVKDTDTFISAARAIHGDKYDYSLTIYVGSQKKLTIVCRNCGPFEIEAESHYRKDKRCGCRACEQKESLERRGMIHLCVDCGKWAKYSFGSKTNSKRCRECMDAYLEAREQERKQKEQLRQKRKYDRLAILKSKEKRSCIDCGGNVTKKSERCLSCILAKRKKDSMLKLFAAKAKRFQKSLRKFIAERKEAILKERSLPVVGVIMHCSECGKSVMRPKAQPNVFCSRKCQWTHNRRKRRARQRKAFVSDVSLFAIAERDGWVCKLCDEPVERDAEYKRQATIDHVIPISKGGTHEPSNCQLAHFDCNSKKHDKVYTLF